MGTRPGSDPGSDGKPFLYVVVCAAGNAGQVDRLVSAAQRDGWEVGVVATPQGLSFLDRAAVEAQTGYPIRSAWRRPGEPRPLPPPDAIAVAPATFNTINKWAAGMADTLAIGVLCEAYGMGIPIAALPSLNSAQAAHPAYRESLRRLRSMGVLIGSYEPNDPQPEGGTEAFRWEEALELLNPVVRPDGPHGSVSLSASSSASASASAYGPGPGHGSGRGTGPDPRAVPSPVGDVSRGTPGPA